jgi:hypothetical protein
MAFLCEISHINPETIHVALAPRMSFFAMLAICAAQCGAQAFVARNYALLRWDPVGWRLQAMLQQSGDGIHACSMPQFLFDSEALLLSQEAVSLLIQSLQDFIAHTLNLNNASTRHGPVEISSDVIEDRGVWVD